MESGIALNMDIMDTVSFRDKGGRRSRIDRRSQAYWGPVLEKRTGRLRRSGIDRRRFKDPIVRIAGDERRRILRDFG